jgi:two-component system, chemotaxis family, protein-glutamate methylesterase/glutaminase
VHPRPTTPGRIKVLIIDDSALVRQLLSEILGADPAIEVVGTAQDAYMAREKIKRLNPHVLTLDVEMPKMDGIQFLRNLMRLRPMPVVMCSSLTERGADVTLDALALGAVDFVTKPKVDVAYRLEDYADEITAKVKAAARARVRSLSADAARAAMPAAAPPATSTVAEKLSADAVLPRRAQPRQARTTDLIVAIGASTGGTEAIREVLVRMPPDSPGIVVTQHIPKAFSGAFAARMNTVTPLTVCEAVHGQQIVPGHVYIAPGDRHLLVVRDGAQYCCLLNDGPPVQRHKPSVDVLFRSVAQNAGPNAIAVMLTGMGRDGAEGMREMRDAGAACVAQDEATSVVWGMPGAAQEAGAVESLHPLSSIAARIMQIVVERRAARHDAA